MSRRRSWWPLTVDRTPAGTLVLTGPAVLVADGSLSEELSEVFA